MKCYSFDQLYRRVTQPPLPRGAVLVEDEDILWAGPAGELPGDITPIHLEGVALPGLVDSHVHLAATGLDLLALSARDFSNIPDLLEAINQLDKSQEGLVRVWGYDQDRFQERRYPTLQELDRACPKNLLWINHIESHGTLVNSNSLAAMGQYGEGSLLTGEDNSRARQFFLSMISPQERQEALEAAARLAIRKGVTCLHAMEGGRLFHNADLEALLAIDLPLDLVVYPQVLDVDWAAKRGFGQIGGCLPLDGSSGVYTAAVSQPYHGRNDCGILYFNREEIRSFAKRAAELDMQIALHACGDRAIDLALDAIAWAREAGSSLAHRVEHFELPRREQADRARELGAVLSMQPAFDWFWGGPQGDYAYTLGPERWQTANPLAWAVEAGVVVAGGSDSGVTPLDPLLGIHAAVHHKSPSQRVTLTEALKMFTEYGALAGRQRAGIIQPGFRANITVLAEDPFLHPSLKDIAVAATIRGGQVVFKK